MYLIIDLDGASLIGPRWFAERYQQIIREKGIITPIFSMPDGVRILYGTIRPSESEPCDAENVVTV